MAIDYQKEIVDKISKLKKEKNAIILAHNYVLGEVQDIADFCGDSLELSRKAANISEEIIVFCGVKFMAETAKILSPEKTVLLPILDAGCPMADMADAKGVRELKKQYPDAVTVCYVNSTADVKTEVDICCTSGNADKVLSSIPDDKRIIFIPDKNLGANTANKLGKEFILWDGFCPTHMRIQPEMVERKKKEFPNAVVIVHPECTPEVVKIADKSLSTGGMLTFAKQTEAKQIIVGTEMGIIHRLQKENPGKQFIPISEQAVCMNMKKINLEDVLEALEKIQHKIELDEDIIKKAKLPITRMLAGKL
ncbi:MAG TPA: quinolinate synthase NadA [Victivallales bacterium]|nr:quinolinate synthase NadA [Victivallales bacterium]